MIILYPLKYDTYYNYYQRLNFTLNETNLILNISGFFINQVINKNIQLNKNALITSTTVLNNSTTILYTYLLIDLYTFKYESNTKPFKSILPHKPEFLIYFDSNLYSNTTNTSINTSQISSAPVYNTAPATSNTISFNTLELSPFMIPYTYINVGTTLPSTANKYDSFYNINTKELFVYLSNTWNKVDWKKYIISDRLYKEGELRINPSTTALEIQSANGTCHEIITKIGALFTPISYTGYVYYIAPGQTYNGYSSSIAPIMAINNMMFRGVNTHYYSSEQWGGIFPSGLTISDGYQNWIAGYSTVYGGASSLKYIPIINNGSLSINWNNYTIHIVNNQMFAANLGYGGRPNNDVVEACIGYGTFPTSGYYLGIWCVDGTGIPIDMISIKREY
jgi:hypothetical protein